MKYRLLIAPLLATVVLNASAQDKFPDHPVRIVVGFTPGGTTDLAARFIAQRLTLRWKQSVIVDNRPGASGMLAADYVARAAPDGYTLTVAPQTSMVVAPALYRKIAYNTLRDFTPITIVDSSPQLLVVKSDSSIKSVRDLVELAKSKPNQLTYGSGGNGTSPHLAGALLSAMMGIKMTHIPYKGESNAADDVLAGRLTTMLSNIPVILPFVKSGQLRALAITSSHRSPLLPAVPTVAESGAPGFDTATWQGLFGPAGMSADRVQQINTDVVSILRDPQAVRLFAPQGVDLVGNSQQAFSDYLKKELEKWNTIVKETGVTVN